MLKYFHDASGNVVSRALENGPSQIVGQPVRQVAAPGDIVTFSVVVADARAVTFQWRFNGADIPRATGDSLLLTSVNAADEGQYSVVVTNSVGSVTSASAALLLDSDRDGLPDSWEIAHFGNTSNQRSAGDPDGDGISNLDEFLDGTDPANKGSFRPRLTAHASTGGSLTVAPIKLSYDLGELVTLTPLPLPPSVFAGWSGDLSGTANPATLTMDRNKTVRARFASAVPLPTGLIALWRSEMDASDLIGGHDGTFFDGTVVTVPRVTASGKVGGAFDFDGTVHVRVPDSAALRPARLTVDAWVFPIAPSPGLNTIIARGSSKDDMDTWLLGLSNNRPEFWSHGNGLLQGPFSIPLNEWTHLAMTFDGLIERLYVNGAQVASRNELRSLDYDAAPVPVTIGSDWSSNVSSQRFNGRIDEISLYNRALTANEVLGIYNADFVGKNFSQPYFTSLSKLPDVILGANYAQPLTTILGTSPIGFSLTAGLLPAGVTVSPTGVVSGIPGMAGIFDFTVQATGADGMSTEQPCVLRVLQAVVPPADLVAWWRGEPGVGNVVADTSGKHDGSFFSGMVAGAPAHTPDGKVGSAFTFDGRLYVRVPDAVELRPPAITVEVWVFPTVLSGNHQTVIARGSSTDDNDTWYLGLFSGKPRFWSHGAVLLEGPSTIPLNEWTHLAITFDSSIKRLYVNGLEVARQGGLGPLVYDAAAVPVTIGADWAFNAPVALFSGRVDEVAIYSRALAADEVAAIYNADAAGKSVV
jgi:hypothetical protein